VSIIAALSILQVSVSQETYAEAVRSKRFNFEWNRDCELFEEEWESYWGGVPIISEHQILDEFNSAVYRKTRLVYAFKSGDDFSFTKKDWGNYVDKKDGGSWVIVNLPPGGSQADQLADIYGIEHKEFTANYEIDAGGGNSHQYAKKEPVRAARAASSFMLKSTDKSGNSKMVNAGDFLVQKIKTSDNDDVPSLADAYIINSQEFKDLYLVHEEDPAARRVGIPPTRSTKMQMYLISHEDTYNSVLGRTDDSYLKAGGASHVGKVEMLQTGAQNVSDLKNKLKGSGRFEVDASSPEELSRVGSLVRRGSAQKSSSFTNARGTRRRRKPKGMSGAEGMANAMQEKANASSQGKARDRGGSIGISGIVADRRRSSLLRQDAAQAMAMQLTASDGSAQPPGGSAGAGTSAAIKKNAVRPTNMSSVQ
jgi:hypothetical protein